MFHTYILYSAKYDRYYIGHCEDMNSRLSRHNNGSVPSTKNYIPWSLVYYEEYSSRAAASNRELEIKKKKSRKYIEFLVKGGGPRNSSGKLIDTSRFNIGIRSNASDGSIPFPSTKKSDNHSSLF